VKTEHIQRTLAAGSVAVAGMLISSAVLSAEPPRYHEPTRHFTVERGAVAENRDFMVDLATGNALDVGGGVRLGLPVGELLLNSAISRDNDNQLQANEATFKFGLPRINTGNRDIRINAAAYAGLAHLDIDEGDDFTNVVIGAAATALVQGVMFTVSPEIEFADDQRDDTIFNLGLAAAYTFDETGFGRFQPNIEYVLVEGGDDDFDKDVDDDLINLGVRWLFKENVTLDFIMLANGPDDITSIPGVIRLNVSF
tara:strand:- start:34995 stop:35756 length:762 start_codon:yes stop_codon:yes gene_type:complete